MKIFARVARVARAARVSDLAFYKGNVASKYPLDHRIQKTSNTECSFMVQMIQEGLFNTFIRLFVTKTAGITREKENDLDDSAATKGQKLDRKVWQNNTAESTLQTRFACGGNLRDWKSATGWFSSCCYSYSSGERGMFLNNLGHTVTLLLLWLGPTLPDIIIESSWNTNEHICLNWMKVFASQLKTCFKQENSLFSYAPLELRTMFHPKPKHPKYSAKAIQHIQNCDTHCLSVMVNLASQPICTLHESRFNFSFCELSGLHENIDHDENC